MEIAQKHNVIDNDEYTYYSIDTDARSGLQTQTIAFLHKLALTYSTCTSANTVTTHRQLAVCSTACLCKQQRKHQGSALLEMYINRGAGILECYFWLKLAVNFI